MTVGSVEREQALQPSTATTAVSSAAAFSPSRLRPPFACRPTTRRRRGRRRQPARRPMPAAGAAPAAGAPNEAVLAALQVREKGRGGDGGGAWIAARPSPTPRPLSPCLGPHGRPRPPAPAAVGRTGAQGQVRLLGDAAGGPVRRRRQRRCRRRPRRRAQDARRRAPRPAPPARRLCLGRGGCHGRGPSGSPPRPAPLALRRGR